MSMLIPAARIANKVDHIEMMGKVKSKKSLSPKFVFTIEDALTANVGKAVEAVIKKEPKKAVIPALKVIGGATGLGPNQVFKTGTGIRDIMTGETDDLRRLIYSDWSLTNYGWPSGADEGRKPIQR